MKTRLFKYIEYLSPKNEKFLIKNSNSFKKIFGEAVLTSTHNLYFEQKYEKIYTPL